MYNDVGTPCTGHFQYMYGKLINKYIRNSMLLKTDKSFTRVPNIYK